MADIAIVSIPVVRKEQGGYRKILMDVKKNNPQLGVYLIAEIISSKYEIDVVDFLLYETLEDKDIQQRLEPYKFVLVSFNSLTYPLAKRVAKICKDIDNEKIIIGGGPHPTLFPKDTMENTQFDYLVRGAGESATIDLLDFLTGSTSRLSPEITSRDQMSNVIRRVDDEIINPSVVWSKYPYINEFSAIPIETSRGCMSYCSFCSITNKKRWSGRNYDELRKNIIEAKKTGIRIISFVDDCLTTSQRHIDSVAELLTENYPECVSIYNGRVTDINNRNFTLEGLRGQTKDILVGAECGYDEGLDKIKKNITSDDIRKSAAKLSKHHISSSAVYSFIIGFPWETVEEIKKTVNLAYQLILDFDVTIFLQWYVPVPGSATFKSTGLPVSFFSEFNNLFSDKCKLVSEEVRKEIDDIVNGLQMLLSLNGQSTKMKYLLLENELING